VSDRTLIEVRGYKWPLRPTHISVTRLLGEDNFGQWLGVKQGDPWRSADHSRSGVFEQSFVKVVPSGTYWTACFNLVDPVVDIDIVLPVRWVGHVLEEVDLELDILRSADGGVHIRDRDEFNRVRTEWNMPNDIAAAAEATCEQVHALVQRDTEPFHSVGHAWLARFLAGANAPRLG
jgi:hypothetical protein